MNPRVTKVEYIGTHRLLLKFDNEEIKQFDLIPYLHYPIYEELNDETYCRKVQVVEGILQWDNDIDFDPDTLYLESKPAISSMVI